MKKLTTLQIACLEYFYKKMVLKQIMRGQARPQLRTVNAMVKRGLLDKQWGCIRVTRDGNAVLQDLRPELFERPDAEIFTCDFKERSGKSFVFGIGDLIEVDFKRRRRVA